MSWSKAPFLALLSINLWLNPQVAAAAPACRAIFQAEAPALPESFQVKRSDLLSRVNQRLRTALISTGKIDTTKLRSEFKHYNLKADADGIMAWIQSQVPPVYALDGTLISGINSRDFRVRVKDADLAQAMGPQAWAATQTKGLVAALADPEVLAQHRARVEADLTTALGDAGLAQRAIAEAERLHQGAIAKMASRGRYIYTDTSSTAKFTYAAQLSPAAVERAARNHGIQGLTPALNAQIRAFRSYGTDRVIAWRTRLAEKLAGNSPDAINAFIADLEERAADAGVIRYRKYRMGPENTSLVGVTAPASGVVSTNRAIKDAPFADNITWFEFKMKATQGEEDLSTVVNKPRFPVSDARINVLKDPSAFIDDAAFEKTRALIKSDIQANVARLKQIGVKEAVWDEAETDAALELIRGLHRQGFSIEPVGRTVYMRDSYNINLLDQGGKSHNVQITRDNYVWELDRTTGELVQALPLVETTHNWHFQFHGETGWFEHVDPITGQVAHVINPRDPSVAYPVVGGQIQRAQPLQGLKFAAVEVIELKVPLEFIRMNDADVRRIPDLAKIREVRRRMVAATGQLNELRNQVDLSAFTVDRGKRSTSRKDVAGGIRIRIATGASTAIDRVFQFHPESGYWVNWDGDEAAYVYHPSLGVLQVTETPSGLVTAPVQFDVDLLPRPPVK